MILSDPELIMGNPVVTSDTSDFAAKLFVEDIVGQRKCVNNEIFQINCVTPPGVKLFNFVGFPFINHNIKV